MTDICAPIITMPTARHHPSPNNPAVPIKSAPRCVAPSPGVSKRASPSRAAGTRRLHPRPRSRRPHPRTTRRHNPRDCKPRPVNGQGLRRNTLHSFLAGRLSAVVAPRELVFSPDRGRGMSSLNAGVCEENGA
ncbi:hypothetical protein L798_01258 [Zootermopsis nevadensis]|uniref:Uncharacterized protein n=1 Tax=Zootermopsis nevadensis TaxID=136037 RepID=A0A067QJJ1_ZOONE|nr:hypothetical protein L798_01258 [Zootermopsis nevadensis]